LLAVSVSPVLLALAACGGSSTGAPPSDAAPTVAKSSKPREAASSIPAASLSGAVTANNAFALDLYSRLRASPTATGNLLTSPISASLALTMTYAGAEGATATQMASALHFVNAASTIFDGQNALSQALDSRASTALTADQETATAEGQSPPNASDYALQIVNSVWGEKTYTWQPAFLDVMAESYGTGVYVEDFVNAWDPARVSINGWVSTATADKINNLLPEGSIDDLTRMVLVNAIHLKFPWATPFVATATAPASFTRGDGTTVSSPFMNASESLPYIDDGAAQIVALPLSGGQLAVIVALPHGDLATYEAGLTTSSASLTQPSAQQLVQLSLPKVAFTSPTFSLSDSLQAMGMVDAFDKTAADFSGLCAQPPDGSRLHITDVLQKAMVAMQETGVEAAAATAVIVGGTDGVAEPPPVPVPMVVNRPYLMTIVDVPTGAVLFVGHIEDPTDVGTP
jgi:serpin B